MKRIFRRTSFKIFISVLALLIIGSAISALSHSSQSPLAAAVSVIFSPAQKLAAKTADAFSVLPFSFRSSTQLRAELEEVEAERDALRDQLVSYEELKRENALYKEFLQLKENHPDQKYVEASVVGRDSSDYVGSFTLNRGSSSGIKVQNPVIYGSNLVGTVVSVSPTSCTVNTLFNPDVNVSCYEIRTGTLGYVTTEVSLAKDGLCCMPNLPADTAVTEGGVVCTSGVGGVYPRDLVIGTIDDIVDATVDISAAANIRPAVDYGKITGVFVITEFTD